MKSENQDIIIGVITSFVIASIFSMIPIWQLIIIPGIIAGVLNTTIKRAVLASAIGTLMAWSLYVISGVILNNVDLILDQFGALIIGPGYGGVFIFLILLMSLAFGAIGGALGYYSKTVINEYLQTKKE